MKENGGIVSFDMCQFGMTVEKDGKTWPVQKGTRLASNSPEVLKRVNVRCPNRGGPGAKHEHMPLEGSLVKRAQIYPREFRRAVCEGVAAEKRLRALGLEAWSIDEISVALGKVSDKRYGEDPGKELHEEEPKWEWTEACDDQSGEVLEPRMVRAARKEEIQYFKEMKVYEKVSIKECWAKIESAPIGVKWVDINKGGKAHPNYRSRLVAK